MTDNNELNIAIFEKASEKVQEVVLPTPLVYSEFFSKQSGNKVYLKPENIQHTGAYKIRGAYFKISTLTDEERSRGLITARQETMLRELHLPHRNLALRQL